MAPAEGMTVPNRARPPRFSYCIVLVRARVRTRACSHAQEASVPNIGPGNLPTIRTYRSTSEVSPRIPLKAESCGWAGMCALDELHTAFIRRRPLRLRVFALRFPCAIPRPGTRLRVNAQHSLRIHLRLEWVNGRFDDLFALAASPCC